MDKGLSLPQYCSTPVLPPRGGRRSTQNLPWSRQSSIERSSVLVKSTQGLQSSALNSRLVRSGLVHSVEGVDTVAEVDVLHSNAVVGELSQAVLVSGPTRAALMQSRRLLSQYSTFRSAMKFSLLASAAIWLGSMWAEKAHQEAKAETMACRKCCGFGVTPCSLCGGTGQHIYEMKFYHVDPCPKCAGKRWEPCQQCGGKYRRSIFQHRRFNFAVQEQPPTLTSRFED